MTLVAGKRQKWPLSLVRDRKWH